MSNKMSKMSIIELSRLGQDLFDFSGFDMSPPINPPIHPGRGVSTNINLQTKSNYIDKFKLY